MALNAASSTQLGCGREIDRVWDHLDRAPDAHELGCPFCRAARADLAGLARATDDLRRGDQSDPDLQPSPKLLERILDVARAEVRRGRRLPLDAPGPDLTGDDPGATSVNTVSEQAVAACIRRTGDRTRDVEIRRCVLTETTPTQLTSVVPTAAPTTGELDDGAPDARPGERGAASVAVSLRVSVARDLSVVEACGRLRVAVIDAVVQEVGLHVVSVDIVVEDLHDA